MDQKEKENWLTRAGHAKGLLTGGSQRTISCPTGEEANLQTGLWLAAKNMERVCRRQGRRVREVASVLYL